MPVTARIYFYQAGQGVDVVCRIPHEMTGENYLTQVTFRRNGILLADVLLGRHVAADPVVGTHVDDLGESDEVSVTWRDITGLTGVQSRVFTGETD